MHTRVRLRNDFNTGDKMKYTVDYFINKFEAIPEDNWITDTYIDLELGCCALGFCGETQQGETNESISLTNLLNGFTGDINDGTISSYSHLRKYRKYDTPKQRILAALYDVKNKS